MRPNSQENKKWCVQIVKKANSDAPIGMGSRNYNGEQKLWFSKDGEQEPCSPKNEEHELCFPKSREQQNHAPPRIGSSKTMLPNFWGAGIMLPPIMRSSRTILSKNGEQELYSQKMRSKIILPWECGAGIMLPKNRK